MQCIGINPCGINQHLVGTTCKCLPGLIVIQNICQRCPTNQSYFAEFDACRCSVGYTAVNGSCILVTCQEFEVYSVNDQACICANGYYRINGTCGQCNMNEVYDASTQSCTVFVPPSCSIHEYFYENCCFCEIGYVRIGGVCIACPENSFYDWNTDSCICKPGYYFVGEKVMRLPVQSHDTGSSFTTNPSYSYSYKSFHTGVPNSEPINIKGSNWDGSGLNINGYQWINAIHPPPIGSRR